MALNIRGGSLTEALLQLSQQAGIELLFDRDVTAGKQAPGVRGAMPPRAALKRLLQDSGLVVRRSSTGLFVVERPSAPTLARQDVTVPEVLVIGRRSQNADIRRLETDIQPYRVATGSEIQHAGRDNLDQYFASRVPSNTTTVSPSLDFNGATNSQIDLRGLGPEATLVLIDGRRMPGIPAQVQGFLQPDLNALPLHAIDRVEVLTGAAGGIYGYGAQGGVVNIVLARGLTGVELHAAGGVTSRGDARQITLEGRIGASLNDGRTDLMLFAAGSQAEPLLNGERAFVARDAKLNSDLAPQQSNKTGGGSVFVTSLNSSLLVLKPAYGGETLSSTFSYLPPGLSGNSSEIAQAIALNAGRISSELSEGAAASQLSSTPRTAAVLANVRHRFDGGVEAYADAVMLWNRGRYRWRQVDGFGDLAATSPLNPFTQAIQVTYPIEAAEGDRTTEIDSARYAVGVVAPLPQGWRATAEAAIGSARYAYAERKPFYGRPFVANTPPVSPFGDWEAFQAALIPGIGTTLRALTLETELRNLSLRLAGPVFQTPHGPATLSLLAEENTESVPAYDVVTGSGATSTVSTIAARRTVTTSLYGEFRAPVFGPQATPLLRNLEVQLAARGDSQADEFARNPYAPDSERLDHRYTDASFTLGAKVTPAQWLALRASYATSAAPPLMGELLQAKSQTRTSDPQRGGPAETFSLTSGGSLDLQSVKVDTASFGVILTPLGEEGPRLTVDYSGIRKTRGIFAPDMATILQFEHLWPQRVTRGPLTDADRARGYTAGPIVALDARRDNSARAEFDMIDASLDWRAALLDGRLRVYGEGAYYLRQRSITPIGSSANKVNYLTSPLAQRANLGADWSIGQVTVGANMQYFGSYRIIPPAEDQDPTLIAAAKAIQGSMRVPAQTYVDLNVSWRGELPLASAAREIKVDLGVINVFDRAPPRESSLAVFQTLGLATSGYSRYGDPRRRRFLLTVSTIF
ncbi:MAG TPA: TonB-dependent receptor [Phenylobacterium sp.]|uniref:TonB-dependent receptor n=1 Tax=Phenylobacterium sp. TaxID=1871053 RepID=UPI002F92B1BB